MKTWEIDGRAGSQKEYAKRQIARSEALLKEYGTCDLAAIEKIEAKRKLKLKSREEKNNEHGKDRRSHQEDHGGSE
jgi:hypothetical protein